MKTPALILIAATLAPPVAGQTPVRDSGAATLTDVVEEQPQLLTLPRLVYPKALKRARVEGRVLVQFILDTSGRAEPPSVTVVDTPDSGFNASAEKFVLAALFRPARVHGRAVRVAMRLPIDFKLNSVDTPASSDSADNPVYEVVDVDEQPELLASQRPEYPEHLRDAGIGGRVMVQFILDTLGRAEVQSVQVIQSPDPEFNQPVIDCLVRSQFRPARIHGRAVRVRLKIPYDFRSFVR